MLTSDMLMTSAGSASLWAGAEGASLHGWLAWAAGASLALVAGAILFFAAYRKPIVGLILVLSGVALSGYAVEVGQSRVWFASYSSTTTALTLRPEYVLVPLAFLAQLARKVARREAFRLGRGAWFGAWIVANLFSTVLRSPDLFYSLRMLYFYGVGILAYLFVVNYIVDMNHLARAMRTVLVFGVAQAAFALTLGGRWLDYGAVRLHGSLLEPVIFGEYCVPLALILTGYGLGRGWKGRRPPIELVGGILLGIVGMLSLSRASWLAMAGGLVVLLGLRALKKYMGGSRAIITGAFTVGAGLAVVVAWTWVAPKVYCSYNYIQPPILQTEGQAAPEDAIQPPILQTEGQAAPEDALGARLGYASGSMRYLMALEVIRESRQDLLIGKGTLTYGLTHGVFGQPSLTNMQGWITSGILLVLHDTGIIGLGVFGLFLILLFADAWRGANAGTPLARQASMGALAGLAAWLVMDQSATSLTLGFTWAFVGLASAISIVSLRSREEEPRSA